MKGELSPSWNAGVQREQSSLPASRFLRMIDGRKRSWWIVGSLPHQKKPKLLVFHVSHDHVTVPIKSMLWFTTTCPLTAPFPNDLWLELWDTLDVPRHVLFTNPILRNPFQDAFNTKLQVDFTKLQVDLRYSKVTSRTPRHFEVNTKWTWDARNRQHETPSRLVQSKSEAELC